MSDDMPEVIKLLLADGWSQERNVNNLNQYAHSEVYTRKYSDDLPECACNQRTPAISVTAYVYSTGDSYEVSLRAESADKWYDLKAYSLRSMEEVSAAIANIKKAWKAVAS